MSDTTDRELLELAAKAAGIRLGWIGDTSFDCTKLKAGKPTYKGALWRPLTDDGDALRLAAELRLVVKPGKHPGDGCSVESQQAGITSCTVFRDDPAEQMRRAIVMVAAEIGKAML